MPGTIDIQTPRLLLRRHIPEDVKPLYTNFGQDPGMFEYSGWNPYATPEATENTIAEFIASYTDPHFYGWAIEHEGRLVGTIGAYDYDEEENTIEVGISVERASWGKGFASEALTAVLRYLVEAERIVTVTAWCASDNIGSQRVLGKCGMVKVGIEKDALQIGKSTFDKLLYEFRTRQRCQVPLSG